MFVCNGVVWQIRYVSAGSKYLRREDGTITIGMTDGLTHTIYLANNLHGRLLEKVLTHELCHVICFSYGLDLDDRLEEKIAQWVANYGKEVVYLLEDLLDLVMMTRA